MKRERESEIEREIDREREVVFERRGEGVRETAPKDNCRAVLAEG